MKVYKLEVMIIDYDEIGEQEIINVLENQRYPNRCISPEIVATQSREIGEWDDDHPLNCEGRIRIFKELFSEE